jgi:drug/metabolite transporter (DMT)-like permease
MKSGRLWGAVAAVIALLMNGVYLSLIHQQGDSPAIWFVAGLTMAGLLALYGALRTARGRRPALIASGVLLLGLGLAAILTIGLSIILAGLLAIIAAARTGSVQPATPTATIGPERS